MEHALARARVITIVQEQLVPITRDLQRRLSNKNPEDQQVAVPPSHRLNMLANALAWHKQRTTLSDRLEETKRVLDLLRKRASTDAKEQALYDYLLHDLGMSDPETQGDSAKRRIDHIRGDLARARLEEERWLDEARLRIALAVVTILRTFDPDTSLQQQLAQKGIKIDV